MVVNRSAPRTTAVPILVYGDVGKASEWLWETSLSGSACELRCRVAASRMRSSTLPNGVPRQRSPDEG